MAQGLSLETDAYGCIYPVSTNLEQGALHVVKGDWKRNISGELRGGMLAVYS